MKIHSVFVIGCGGTGSHLIEPLARLLAFHKNGTRHLTLADGDIYEEGNASRQLFAKEFEGVNKAAVQRGKIADFFPECLAIQAVMDRDSIIGKLEEAPIYWREMVKAKEIPQDYLPVIIMAVDNTASRVQCLEALDALKDKLQNFLFVDPGNALLNGGVQIHMKWEGKFITTDPREKFEIYRNVPDRLPGGCSKDTAAAPQHIIANFTAAQICLNYIRAVLDDESFPEEVFFDMKDWFFGKQGMDFKMEKPKEEAPVPKNVAPLEEILKKVEDKKIRKTKKKEVLGPPLENPVPVS